MGSRPSKKHKRKEASVDPDAMEVDPTAMEVDPEAMEGVENAVSTGRLRDAMSAMAIGANRYGLRDRSARKTYFQPDSPGQFTLLPSSQGPTRKKG